MQSYSIYLHIPFCRHRCNYCDFNTYARIEDLIPTYCDALIEEIKFWGEGFDQSLPVHTVFFGGGTPSLVPHDELNKILQALHSSFDIDPLAEITLEANPGRLTQRYLNDLFQIGFNRLSLGMQSAQPRELAFLERQHTFGNVLEAVKRARISGFKNLSLDLIFGLPEQLPAVWGGSLDLALSLAPEHFSLYALTIEPGTPLGAWCNRGLVPEPDPDLAADMYELAAEKLEQAGFQQYEISNWARGSMELASQHNLQYWRNQPYLGLGAGAHGFVNGFRVSNILSPREYIQRWRVEEFDEFKFPKTPVTATIEQIAREREMTETMMMGLRLTQEGVSKAGFEARFGASMDEIFTKEIDDLVALALLEWYAGRLRLTNKGRLLGNQVFRRFV